ncbi:MAG: Sarcosine oxidase alpha subunit [Devosia sp.]|uniref:NAD(P)/FAD-dependent oxidoreductase n=1 Tax=Devosia sp. TaxID=1871048 RepID=UPI002624822E|nr:FAD-dependent oxidoreductase [Devosia sp.]MDB5586119.1 Sarcosine oxidase alpha subunit [Devosia sp.]
MSTARHVDVAIVGGGPAGLGAAMALRRAGIESVVVIEREAEAGGVPRHCGHPAFGVREFGRPMSGPRYARALVGKARAAGVEILTRHSVVALEPEGRLLIANPDGALTVTARRVILATGARESTRAARLVSGDRPLGVVNTGALQAYLYLQGLTPFRRPVIVGTELVSLSAIWTCLAHGIRPQAVIAEGDRAVARWPMGLFPHLLGIPVHYNTQVEAITGTGRVDGVRVSRNGRPSIEIACDGVLLTGHFVPEASLMRSAHIAVDRNSGGPAVDQFHRCSDPSYFATGNLLRGIETAGWCHREGLALGRRVAADLSATPALAATIPITVAPQLKYAVPQRLAPGISGNAPALQLRLSEPFSGELVVTSGSRELLRRPLRSRPERRILVPLSNLSGADDPITIRLQ